MEETVEPEARRGCLAGMLLSTSEAWRRVVLEVQTWMCSAFRSRAEVMLDENTQGEIESEKVGGSLHSECLGNEEPSVLTGDLSEMGNQERVSWEPREQSYGFYNVLPKAPLGVVAVSPQWREANRWDSTPLIKTKVTMLLSYQFTFVHWVFICGAIVFKIRKPLQQRI